MTAADPNRLVAEELARAEQAVQAAANLLAGNLLADAISRAYYGAFHFVQALLQSRGIETRTHLGAIHLFGREFVNTGKLKATYTRLLASLQRQRELADYNAAVSFDPEDVRDHLDQVRGFGKDARELLRSEGHQV